MICLSASIVATLMLSRHSVEAGIGFARATGLFLKIAWNSHFVTGFLELADVELLSRV